MEFRPVAARHADMQLIDSLVSDTDALEDRAGRYRLTQRCFRQDMPPWLAAVVGRLPSGRRNKGCSVIRQEMRMVGDAERKRQVGWREMRAALLFKMIGKAQ